MHLMINVLKDKERKDTYLKKERKS